MINNINELVTNIYKNVKGIETKGYNNEQEFLECIINSVRYFESNFTSLIKVDDLPDKVEFSKVSKSLSKISDLKLEDKKEISFAELYICRLYESISVHGLDLSSIDLSNLQNITIDGTCLKGESTISFSKSDRENIYINFKNLDKDTQLKFLQELRKKVISHEFAHLSMPSHNSFRGYEFLDSLEEILVERIALNSENTHRKTAAIETTPKGKMIRQIPNLESSNYRIFAIGEILSKIVGEEKMQTSRLLGASTFFRVISEELNYSAEEMKDFGTMINAATNVQTAKYFAKKQNSPMQTLPPEEIRIRYQLLLENKLLTIYKEKILSDLTNAQDISKDKLEQLYKDCADIRQVILKHEDKIKQNEMPSIKTLKEIIIKLDELAQLKGINPQEIKNKISQEIKEENNHYINQQTQTLAV